MRRIKYVAVTQVEGVSEDLYALVPDQFVQEAARRITPDRLGLRKFDPAVRKVVKFKENRQ